MQPPCLTESEASPPPTLTPEQLHRWAKLIADGNDRFPEHLQDPDRQRLASDVRRLVRERMVNLVAFAIAIDVTRTRLTDTEARDD